LGLKLKVFEFLGFSVNNQISSIGQRCSFVVVLALISVFNLTSVIDSWAQDSDLLTVQSIPIDESFPTAMPTEPPGSGGGDNPPETPTNTPTPTVTPTPYTPPPPTIVCGNGKVENNEQCDDGDKVDDNACSNNCILNFCGDKKISQGLGEQCEDGNLVNDDDCNKCKLTTCGDKVLQTASTRKEQCDDGNKIDDDACSNACKTPKCGDLIVQAIRGELCDDGNKKDDDACSNKCQVNFCGDGKVQAGLKERCDWGKKNGHLLEGRKYICTERCLLKKMPKQKKEKVPGANGAQQPVGFGGGGGGGNGNGGGGGGSGISDLIGRGAGTGNVQMQLPKEQSLAGTLEFTDLPAVSGIKMSCAKGKLADATGKTHDVNLGLAQKGNKQVGIAGSLRFEDKDFLISGDSKAQAYTMQAVNMEKLRIDPPIRSKRVTDLKKLKTKSQITGRSVPYLNSVRRARSINRRYFSTLAAKTPKDCGTDIKVLFAYTQSIEDKVETAASIAKALCDANEVFKNNSLPFKFVPIGIAKIDSDVSGNAADDIGKVSNPKGDFTKLHALRFKEKADLVSLVVPDLKSYCGFASIMPEPGLKNTGTAFSLVVKSCLGMNNYVLAHEFGHNLGMDHDKAHAGSGGARPWAYGFKIEGGPFGGMRDIMAYPPGVIAPYYSSPDVVVGSHLLGVKGEADNASVAKETSPFVACYGESLK